MTRGVDQVQSVHVAVLGSVLHARLQDKSCMLVLWYTVAGTFTQPSIACPSAGMQASLCSQLWGAAVQRQLQLALLMNPGPPQPPAHLIEFDGDASLPLQVERVQELRLNPTTVQAAVCVLCDCPTHELQLFSAPGSPCSPQCLS